MQIFQTFLQNFRGLWSRNTIQKTQCKPSLEILEDCFKKNQEKVVFVSFGKKEAIFSNIPENYFLFVQKETDFDLIHQTIHKIVKHRNDQTISIRILGQPTHLKEEIQQLFLSLFNVVEDGDNSSDVVVYFVENIETVYETVSDSPERVSNASDNDPQELSHNLFDRVTNELNSDISITGNYNEHAELLRNCLSRLINPISKEKKLFLFSWKKGPQSTVFFRDDGYFREHKDDPLSRENYCVLFLPMDKESYWSLKSEYLKFVQSTHPNVSFFYVDSIGSFDERHLSIDFIKWLSG
ncbi:predicted protein [Naegleria gruberi]|uniref:Predicted protein n=1 Tax=Naegleria gruberi TaxID=5762 RepID=D2VW09_NAEGR|nr:uncharacterized protein NAEGRDRAFT_73208 [Naegleria gruberi]EFC38932.1 predicted protein [Naegleria gruberi]|eukprot:XP_002671676.1 predicted protein [Naegleria gruberi strain NEG-M]